MSFIAGCWIISRVKLTSCKCYICCIISLQSLLKLCDTFLYVYIYIFFFNWISTAECLTCNTCDKEFLGLCVVTGSVNCTKPQDRCYTGVASKMKTFFYLFLQVFPITLLTLKYSIHLWPQLRCLMGVNSNTEVKESQDDSA